MAESSEIERHGHRDKAAGVTLRALPDPDFKLTPFPDGVKPTEGRRLLKARADAEQQAWSSLARYKFWMFGYHAAQWVLLNRVADKKDRQGNPFKALVAVARQRDRMSA